MEYKEIFKTWWFWALVFVHAIIIGSAVCIGRLLGSIFVGFIYVSIGWGIYWIGTKIYNKIKNK